MQKGRNSYRKSQPSRIYSLISNTLALFLLGAMLFLGIYAHTLTQFFREQLEITIILKETITPEQSQSVKKWLEGAPFVKSYAFISKEEAAKIMEKTYGEDAKVLGYNPYYASYQLFLKADYAHPDSLPGIEKAALDLGGVHEFFYMRDVLNLLNDWIRKAGLLLATIVLILLIITLALLDNTIKLMMYSQRFLIRSMQLVGATRWFIIKPYIQTGFWQGLWAAALSLLALGIAIYFMNRQFEQWYLAPELPYLAAIPIIVIVVGISMGILSTYLSVNRYLRMRLDDLF